MKELDGIIKDFSDLIEVEAIALGGSRATGVHDDQSDYDLYIYINKPINPKIREEILKKYSSYMEIGNQYWELEDDCILNSSIPIDIIYRNLSDVVHNLNKVVYEHMPSNAYSTCIWNNMLSCIILYDRKGLLAKVKNRYHLSYPEQLKSNIISRGMKLLSGYLPSFDAQIVKAAERHDLVSINHRITEFLATYFDVLFALNKLTHPGEKRMLEHSLKHCTLLPLNHQENIHSLLLNMTDPKIIKNTLESMMVELSKII